MLFISSPLFPWYSCRNHPLSPPLLPLYSSPNLIPRMPPSPFAFLGLPGTALIPADKLAHSDPELGVTYVLRPEILQIYVQVSE